MRGAYRDSFIGGKVSSDAGSARSGDLRARSDGRRRSVFRRGVYQPDGRVDPFGYASDLGAGRRRLRRHHLAGYSRMAGDFCGGLCGRRADRPRRCQRRRFDHDVLGGGGGKHADAGRRRLPAQRLVRWPQDVRYARRRGEVRISRPRHDDDQRDRRCRRLVRRWIPRMERRRWRMDDVVAARCGRRARCCAGRRAVGARRCPTFQAQQGFGVRRRTCRRGDRRRHCLQPADRADRVQECTRIPRRPAAGVGGAKVRTTRHRDDGAHSFGFRRLGRLGGQRSLHGNRFQRIVPAVRHVHDRRFGSEVSP